MRGNTIQCDNCASSEHQGCANTDSKILEQLAGDIAFYCRRCYTEASNDCISVIQMDSVCDRGDRLDLV